MSNSIDKFEGENNSMNFPYTFTWKARFKDESTINQFDNNKIEHQFKEVKDRIKELTYFYLLNNFRCFTIDLKNGLIFFNNHQKIQQDLLQEEKNNIRLIFFRRHIIEVGLENLKEQNHVIIYFLGLQYNDKNGNNRKIILQIDKLGNFIIGE